MALLMCHTYYTHIVEDNAPTQDAIYVCSHCIHVNVVGAKRRGSVVLMLGYRRQW